MAETLSQNGFEVVHQARRDLSDPAKPFREDRDIPTGISDPDLYAIAGARGYVVLTKDLRTRYRTVERVAVVQNNLAVFQLVRGNLTGPEMAQAFISAKQVIEKLLSDEPRPFIARITREGKLSKLISRDTLIESLDTAHPGSG